MASLLRYKLRSLLTSFVSLVTKEAIANDDLWPQRAVAAPPERASERRRRRCEREVEESGYVRGYVCLALPPAGRAGVFIHAPKIIQQDPALPVPVPAPVPVVLGSVTGGWYRYRWYRYR